MPDFTNENVAYTSNANVFTQVQKINIDNGQQITFYRPVSTNSFGVGFYYDLRNSSSAEVTYGNQYIAIDDNTAGAHYGKFVVQLARAGSLNSNFALYAGFNNGCMQIGDNLYVTLAQTGLTGARTYTFPDASVQLTGTSDAATLTSKTMQSSANTFSGVLQDPLVKRSGSYQPAQGTTATTVGATSGMLAAHTPIGAGTNSNTFDTTEGVLINLATSTTAGVNAGLIPLTSGVGQGRRLFGMRARIRSKVDTVAGSVSRFYFGFSSATALPFTDTPLAVADSGVIVGFSSADTTYQIYHNDGATSVTKDAVTGAIAKDTAFHTIEISWTAAGSIAVIFDGVTQIISTDLPATTANLFFYATVQNVTAAARTHSIKGIWLEADK